MKQQLTGLSQRYVTALRKHLKPGSRANPQAALELGRQAVNLGLETLELARIHERALVLLKPSAGKSGMTKRAEIFYAKAAAPLVENHRETRQSKDELRRLNVTLSRRTVELATTNRHLQQGLLRRKAMEEDFEKSGKNHAKCLEKSLLLQKKLRRSTHGVLAAQEVERKKLSCELQDEIAQTLLGINVRLISLKQEARRDTKEVKNQIASAQRLVVKSAHSVRQFARELEIRPPQQ